MPHKIKNLKKKNLLTQFSGYDYEYADMPPGTDCPYPIRILAFFEMIRPYHVVIRSSGKLLKEKQISFIVDTTSFFH